MTTSSTTAGWTSFLRRVLNGTMMKTKNKQLDYHIAMVIVWAVLFAILLGLKALYGV